MDKDVEASLARCEEMIKSWRSDTIFGRKQIEALRSELGLLEYLTTQRLTAIIHPGPAIGNPICSEPGCKARWRDGLLNHASAGDDPVWYCTVHVKPLEHSHHIPGQGHPLRPQIQRAEDLKRQAEWFLGNVEKMTNRT
jgi:hypothetical protein